MKRSIFHPISITLALCVAVMGYLLLRPAPDRSVRLTLVFHEAGGLSPAVPWRDGQEVLAALRNGHETYVIEPDEIARYEWSVHVLHLTPAGVDRLRARFGGGDVAAVSSQLIAAQPGFVVTVGDEPVVAGAVVANALDARVFLGQRAEPIVEVGDLRFRFDMTERLWDPGTIADRRLYEAIRSGGLLAETCADRGEPFEIRIARLPTEGPQGLARTYEQTLDRLATAELIARLPVESVERYSWTVGLFELTPEGRQKLIETLALPERFGEGDDPGLNLVIGGYLGDAPLWAGQIRSTYLPIASEPYTGVIFVPDVRTGRLRFTIQTWLRPLDVKRGLANICVRQAFADAGRVLEAP